MKTKHNMSQHQILDTVFDYDRESIKVHQDDVSHNFSLSALSDSIVAVMPFMEVAKDVVQDCRMFKRVAIYSSGPCSVLISPKDGVAPSLLLLASSEPLTMRIIDICCASIQLSSDSDAMMVLQG